VFHFGIPPQRIDILTSITGVEFDEAWSERIKAVFDDVPLAIIGR
jgi:hypothetical protein